jgi:hypothetical protein
LWSFRNDGRHGKRLKMCSLRWPPCHLRCKLWSSLQTSPCCIPKWPQHQFICWCHAPCAKWTSMVWSPLWPPIWVILSHLGSQTSTLFLNPKNITPH